ncbi:hypothetical protein BKA83DRAFT_4398120 [Pisolithus microcarpus]|nr:hypothetical protein BKA83DRAFT_4398120 [Pisolithus microcarpus]
MFPATLARTAILRSLGVSGSAYTPLHKARHVHHIPLKHPGTMKNVTIKKTSNQRGSFCNVLRDSRHLAALRRV